MPQESLNHLAIMKIEHDIFRKVNVDDVTAVTRLVQA